MWFYEQITTGLDRMTEYQGTPVALPARDAKAALNRVMVG
jgi:hypothetical protein